MTEEANSSDNGDSLAVTLGLEEVGPTGTVLLLVKVDGCTNLGVFELDEFVILVAFAMPLGEDSKSFFMAVFVAQPTRGFGHKRNKDENDQRADGLKERG